MLKNSFKKLSIGLLIMSMGSTIVATSVEMGNDPAIISKLKRTLKKDASDFSTGLFKQKDKTVDDFLINYSKKGPMQEEILTAVIIGAVECLTGNGSDKVRVTARLASFLLGNRLLPPTYGWLDDDVEILTYLRNPDTASVTDTSSLIYQLTQKFINGAKNFTKTYSLFNDFTLTQHSFDVSEIFGDAGKRLMPSAVDIFNEAVISNWGEPIVIQKDDSAGDGYDDGASSVGRSTTSGGTHSSVTGLSSQSAGISSDQTEFATILYGYPSSKSKEDATKSMQDALIAYKNAPSKQPMLAAAFKGILDCFTVTQVDVSRVAHWKVARLAYFLLANRLLPPTHEWLGVVHSTTGEQEDNNNMRLEYLMGKAGMLQTAMNRLLKVDLESAEAITPSLNNVTRLHNLAIIFEDRATKYDDKRKKFRDLAEKQRALDKKKIFGKTRRMPSTLTIFNASMRPEESMYKFVPMERKLSAVEEEEEEEEAAENDAADDSKNKEHASSYSSYLYWAVPVAITVVGVTWFLKDNDSVKRALANLRHTWIKE